MSDQIGFIGDIHGMPHLLEALLEKAIPRVSHLVFLGDYVNRGPKSKQVIERLVELKADRVSASFLAGNHDIAFLRAIRSGEFTPFLRVGGASTLASYVEGPITNLSLQVRQAVPAEHVAFLYALQAKEARDGYVAQHHLNSDVDLGNNYGVFGHVPQKSLLPRIGRHYALVDTGSGTWPDGRLTCFLWPSKAWFQVSSDNSRAD